MFSPLNFVYSHLCLLHVMAMASPPYVLSASSRYAQPLLKAHVHYDEYAPPAKKDFQQYLNKFIKGSTVAANLLTLACFVAFAFLVGIDVWRAFKKRATWLPGKAFALSGVTVQIIVWWTSLSNIANGYNRDIRILIWNHYVVVSGRVAVCVFIGYLLPGMAAPSVRVFGALAVTICAQIASEVLLLFNPADDKVPKNSLFYSHWIHSHRIQNKITRSKIADLIIMVCVIVLGLILCCTVLASKTIHGLLRQRISAIAEKSKFQSSNEKMKSFSSSNFKMKSSSSITEEEGFQFPWNDFEDEVLTSWFVARVCRVDYVISRSVFTSAVWAIVTISVTVCVIVFYKSLKYYDPTIFPLLCFTIIGWLVICWRWLAAQLYYPATHSWKRFLCLEDFWTSHTLQLIAKYDLKRERQQFQKSNSEMPRLNKSPSLLPRIFTKVRLHKLLYLVLALQVCVVFFSKICALLSDVTVGKFVYWCRRFVYRCHEFVYWCRKCILKKDPVTSDDNYEKLLESLCMPGEDPTAMWEANKMSLYKAKRLMKKGCKEGSSCEEIYSTFGLYSAKWAEDGAQLLNLLKKKALPSVLSHFSSVEKQRLKMTVVSLISIFIRLHKTKSEHLIKIVKSCQEVWDLVSFADECDIDLKADTINIIDDLNRDNDQVSMAANREFYKLHMEYNKLSSGCQDSVLDGKEVHGFLKDLKKKCKRMLIEENLLDGYNSPRDLTDSKDWTKIAPSYTLYKLCKLMLEKDNEDLVKWTEESLRNVVALCMSRLPDMLVKQCWKWAQEFEEDKLWEAIQLAGKCRGMMEEWGREPKATVNSTQHKTLYQRFRMCIPCRPAEESPSPGEKTLSNAEQCTIEVKESSSPGVSRGTP